MDIVFILVEPARGENIGAAARAIKTMGFSQLRLVNPGDMTAAHWVAHHSNDVLEQAMIVDSLAQALVDVDLSIACTARHRLQKDRYVDADHCAALVAGKGTAYSGWLSFLAGKPAVSPATSWAFATWLAVFHWRSSSHR